MNWKSFFTKQKKKDLDHGLEKTKKSFFSKIASTVAGKSKVDEEVLDDLEEVLVSSDVSVKTTLKFIKRLEERVKNEKYVGIIQLSNLLKEEISEMLSEIFDGATIMVGGFGEAGSPIELLHGLIDNGAKDLTIIANNAGNGRVGLGALIGQKQVRKVICSFARSAKGLSLIHI